MVRDWAEIERQEVGDYYIFRLNTVKRRSPRTGKTHRFVMLDAGDWINVIAVTEAKTVLFVHQFRHGSAEITMEIPAGMVDSTDADPADAARRELMEETGYSAENFIKIGTVEPNPAFLNNRCHTYLALDAYKVREPEPEGSEDIFVSEVLLDQLDELVISGQITHSLVVCAFYHYNRYRSVTI